MKRALTLMVFLTALSYSYAQQNMIDDGRIKDIMKNNATHQKRLLEMIDLFQEYDDSLSAVNNANIKKIETAGATLELSEKIILFASETKILSVMDMNLSYILDLTQTVFSLCELSEIISSGNTAQNKYLLSLNNHIKDLWSELDNKNKWIESIEEHYSELKDQRALTIVKSTRGLIKEMRTYYSLIQKL
jgi:hypothetical protein